MRNESQSRNAFPGVHTHQIHNSGFTEEVNIFDTGLDKREYYASTALQAVIMANKDMPPQEAALKAVSYADELVNALQVKDEPLPRMVNFDWEQWKKDRENKK